jgi:hypothetical protein
MESAVMFRALLAGSIGQRGADRARKQMVMTDQIGALNRHGKRARNTHEGSLQLRLHVTIHALSQGRPQI